MNPESKKEYLLGANQKELDRLRFQHNVWRPVTEQFFDRTNVREGWHCLDVGGGPGFVAADLCQRVGPQGSVTILEPSDFYRECVDSLTKEQHLPNLKFLHGTAESIPLPEEQYDLIFMRWVLSFIPSPEILFANIVPALKKGGILAIQDYYYEGLSLYPHGDFNKVADIMRAYYRSNGGNAYIAGSIPSLFRTYHISLQEFSPHCLSGGPESSITEWAGQFFTMHLPIMAQKGFISSEQCDEFLNDWNAHRKNPDMVFFSPIVVDISGVKS